MKKEGVVMCKYCNLKSEMPEDSGYVMHLKDRYTGHWFADLGFYPCQGEVEISADALNEEFNAIIKINYCPMCGRKLGEE